MTLRIAMLGTGAFALPTFRGLLESRHEVVGLVTQPDRTGVGHHQHRNPLKELAESNGLPVFQPVKASAPESLDVLVSWSADLYVVAAYGQILSSKLLSLPRLGAINVHASILPKYRGASPIQQAVWQGETETGVTIFQIVRELDAGPVLAIERTPLGTNETSGELEERLANLAVPVLLRVVDQLDTATATPQPQDHSQATYARRLTKADGEIDWTQNAAVVACHVRAMQPWPKAYTFWQRPDGSVLRLIVPSARDVTLHFGEEPGTVFSAESGGLMIHTACGIVELTNIQPEGKRVLTAAEFVRGYPIQAGQRFVRSSPSATGAG